MVKPLTFKGDKKPSKKRKRAPADEEGAAAEAPEPKALVKTTEEPAEDDDSWVNAEAVADISGPVIIVLPTDHPSCLSCDNNGKVFSIQVEEVEGDHHFTAEPHDVRQVWVATRIAGTESFSFKGHHGKYLTCDKFGVLSATREAISPEESFLCIPVADNPGAFGIQTQRDKFLAIDEDKGTVGGSAADVRGDAEFIEFRTTFRIRMQARFKPKLKANKEERAREKISRKELEEMVGRRLEDNDVKMLKRARRDGNFHEVLLDVKVKGKHDKFA
ncbi:actin-crosslinking protein [Rhizodiscina lignyota]|uniref:Actin-crosslinking protein n=1 Tax=Rhizodiscina lignyota TaxID=1504668 RepID=A0A9P4M7E7_9PEZI|nr:actin-crosslinking protein [Rhizodiscina lignyota]